MKKEETPDFSKDQLLLNLGKSPLFKFIKEYPRVSSLLAFLIIVILLSLPIPFSQKIKIPLRAMVIAFLLTWAWQYFRTKK